MKNLNCCRAVEAEKEIESYLQECSKCGQVYCSCCQICQQDPCVCYFCPECGENQDIGACTCCSYCGHHPCDCEACQYCGMYGGCRCDKNLRNLEFLTKEGYIFSLHREAINAGACNGGARGAVGDLVENGKFSEYMTAKEILTNYSELCSYFGGEGWPTRIIENAAVAVFDFCN